MLKITTSTNYYQFEPVHIVWTGLRTQMVIGLLSIFCVCTINFIPFFCQTKTFFLAEGTLIDFTLYFASCLLVALITLAIGTTSGNRNGAGSGIWASLIFAVSPWQVIACSTAVRSSRIISFFILVSAFLVLRMRSGKGTLLFLLTIAGAAYASAHWEVWRFDTTYVAARLEQLATPGYVMAFLILFWRLIAGAINWQTVARIILYLLAAFMCTQLYLISVQLSAAAVLAIALSLACLPTLGAAPARANRIFGSLGLIALTVIAIAYEQLFI